MISDIKPELANLKQENETILPMIQFLKISVEEFQIKEFPIAEQFPKTNTNQTTKINIKEL